MAANKPRGYRPTEEPEPPRLTLDEFAQFKKLFEDSSLAWWIRLAGLGATVEVVRIGWLAVRYVWKF